MARPTVAILGLGMQALPALGSQLQLRQAANANPIRRVVNMLQEMQDKITKEGEKEKEIYDKYTCYCKNGASDLGGSIAAAEAKISSLPSDVEAAEESLAQAKNTLKKAQDDRSAAKQAMADSTDIRQKEAAAFAALKAEQDANMGAIAKAVAALENGMAGAFLQTPAAAALQKLANGKEDMAEDAREAVLAFLSAGRQGGASEYAPSSGQITGILKELSDDMGRDLAEATNTETKAIEVYQKLMDAKTKEVTACTAQIEAKTQQIGELGVQIVELKEDLSDTEKSYTEDKKFLADLNANCLTRAGEWEVVVKTRSQELAALADTIKMLNSDDALELFKKALPASSASFIQLRTTEAQLRQSAVGMIRARRATSSHRVQFDLLELALTGKKVPFDKVLLMIDDMVKLLKEEQLDDDHKKEYCEMQFDVTDDKKKDLERTLSLESTAIDKAKDAIATLADEIAALEAGIKALDQSVAEATEQRKEENDDHQLLMQQDTAAKSLLSMAKERLNKFYNPRMASLAQVAPPPPPEAVGAYQKKGEESNGVIAILDTIIGDLDKEMTESTQTEKEAQKDYEQMMADSADKRKQDSNTLSQKVATKAATQQSLEDHQGAHKDAQDQLMATEEYLQGLHGECDWLMTNFESRKEARNGEIKSLKTAKEVLSGAQ